MKLKKVLSLVAAGAAAASLAVSASAANAGLTFQTGSYGFRNNINQNTAYWWDDDIQEEFGTWKFTDADVTADGQYTVSFEKDDSDGAATWNMLKLQFLISQTDYPDFNVTIDSLKIDGTEVAAAKNAVIGTEEVKPDDYTDTDFEGKQDYYVVAFYNTYNSDQQFIKSDDYGQKVEVTFTVSGYKAAAGEGTQAPADNNTSSNDKNSPNTGVTGVAAVAGLAVLATGAVIIAKKRK